MRRTTNLQVGLGYESLLSMRVLGEPPAVWVLLEDVQNGSFLQKIRGAGSCYIWVEEMMGVDLNTEISIIYFYTYYSSCMYN